MIRRKGGRKVADANVGEGAPAGGGHWARLARRLFLLGLAATLVLGVALAIGYWLGKGG